MKSRSRLAMCVPLLAALVFTLPVAAEAQGRPSPRGEGRGPGRGDISRSDIQDQFDAYAIVQAQDVLHLTDEQYPQFVRRARALHSTRRRIQADRVRLITDLGQLLRARNVDDARLEAATRALDDHEREAAGALQQAYRDVDEVLTVRQRAQFRVLEQQLERKKLDMLMRARQRR